MTEIEPEERDQIRRYLLGELPEADEERVELRLLTDDDYSEEAEIVENELTDEYLRGELTPDQRRLYEGRFLRAPERQRKLAFASALAAEAAEHAEAAERAGTEARKVIPFVPARRAVFSSVYVKIAAAVVLLAGAGFGLRALLEDRSDVRRGLLALNEAYKGRRLVESRVSGLDHAPVELLRSGVEPNIDKTSRDLAELLLLQAVRKQPPEPGARHALGRHYLAARRFAEAREQLALALAEGPDDAQLHADMGAVLLEMGAAEPPDESGKRTEYFAESQKHLERALELDGSSLEARFNRALLFEHMRLPQARDEWRAYVERDPNSRWADEARARLKSLEDRQGKVTWDEGQSLRDFDAAYGRGDDDAAWEALRRSHTSAGNAVTNALLDAYLDADAKGDAAAAGDKLKQLRLAARLEEERAGDGYTSALASFYERADAPRRAALRQARAQMKRGYALFRSSDMDGALASYAQAKLAFERAGDEAEAIFAEYRAGHCQLFRPDLKASTAIFERLLPECERRGYAWLLGQCLYFAATVQLGTTEYSKAIDYSRRALELSERTQNTSGVLKTLNQLGGEYHELGDGSRALGYFQRALALADGVPVAPAQAWEIFTGLGLSLHSRGLHHAALEYQKEALRLAREADIPLYVSRSYDYLGQTHASLGRYEEALAHVGRGFEVAGGLADQLSGKEMLANTSLHAGDIYRQSGDHAKALEAYDRSVRLYEEFGLPHFNYPARKGRLLALMARGDERAVEDELPAVLDLFEQYRSKLSGEGQRNTFFDAEQGVYDLAIDFAHSRKHDARLAFYFSESSRARSLRDAMSGGARVSERGGGPELDLSASRLPRTTDEVLSEMPDGAQVLQYGSLEDKLLIWVITREGITLAESPVGARDLALKVEEFRRAVSRAPSDGGQQARRLSQDLYAALIRPVLSRLDPDKLLCIVPDKSLHFLPFAALAAPDTDRYLVEDFRFTLSPSSNIFIDCSKEAEAKAAVAKAADGAAGAGGAGRLLSVGDPSFDRAAFPSLAPLPSAAREARAVAAGYGRAPALLGLDARESSIRAALPDADVAHFALHYVADERSNMLSGLVLAAPRPGDARAAGGGDGVLRVHEIYDMRLPRTRLVVLSACQTGVEQQYRGEGAVGAARPFLKAGVPLVVASLWPVDSDATADLMINFHGRRARRQEPTAEALRRAQLDMLRDERRRHPFYWAGFAAIGGHTNF